MRAFEAYAWPGNIRELENVVERALILTDGPALAIDPQFPGGRAPATAGNGTLREVERLYILDVLSQCGGRVAGPGNAAERLGLNRSTLLSRMKKLGIIRRAQGSQGTDFRDDWRAAAAPRRGEASPFGERPSAILRA